MSASPRLSFLPERLRRRACVSPVPLRWVASAATQPLSRSCVSLHAALLPERFRVYAFGGAARSGALSCVRRKLTLFFQRQNVCDVGLDVGVAHRRIRWHRHRTPHARAALLHFLLELRRGALVAAILLGDVLVRR